MGIKLSTFQKTKEITVEGLTVMVRGLAAGDEMLANQEATTVKNLQELIEKRNKNEDNIDLEKYIEIDQAKMTMIKTMRCIMSWDLEDDEGNILPVTEENIALLPQVVFEKISEAINEVSFTPSKEELGNLEQSESPKE